MSDVCRSQRLKYSHIVNLVGKLEDNTRSLKYQIKEISKKSEKNSKRIEDKLIENSRLLKEKLEGHVINTIGSLEDEIIKIKQ